jgi:hypothetical protein
MEDLWDGRLILTIFEAIVGKEKVVFGVNIDSESKTEL